jgi:hypothetical protein
VLDALYEVVASGRCVYGGFAVAERLAHIRNLLADAARWHSEHRFDHEGDQLRLYAEDGSTALPRLMRLLDSDRIGLRSIRLSEPTLDDVFLPETGRSLRDAGTTTEGAAA